MYKALWYEVEKMLEVPTYLVGGSVRDILINREPKDYDFCTAMIPDEVEAKIKASGKHAYGVGKRFGTLGCKINNQMIEITTFRSEKYNSGSRKPEVEFGKLIQEDLASIIFEED